MQSAQGDVETAEYIPTSHRVQIFPFVTEPAPHTTQLSACVPLYVPAPHTMQETEPKKEANVPASQGAQ